MKIKARALAHVLAAAGAFSLCTPALAQKAKDTIRIALREPIVGVDNYFDPKEETSLSMRAVFDSLVFYDDQDGKYKPLLAKSWRRIDDRTLEFELRGDVKWHDGKPFTADDVLYTFRWLIDPNNRLRFTSNYKFVERIDQTGPWTVRVTSKAPYALDLHGISHSFLILPKHLHEPLANKLSFAMTPVGTGPYRATSVNANTGIMLERNHDYRHGGDGKVPSNVGRYHLLPVPDKQTQMAQLMVGDLDIVNDLTKDEVEGISKDKRIAITVSQGFVYSYLLLDAKGRAGNKPVQDRRVREAIFRAIDRGSIARNYISDEAKPLDAICLPQQFGCAFDVKAPAYDLEVAKKLMAEAGYSKGFDLEIVTTGRSNQMAEVAANMLRRINIRASVRPVTFVAYRTMQQQGQYSALLHTWTSYGGTPDVAAHMDFFYGATGRDYAGDARLTEITALGESTIDADKRAALYREAMTRINEQAYITVVSTLPSQFAHSSSVAVRKGSSQSFGFSLWDLSWK